MKGSTTTLLVSVGGILTTVLFGLNYFSLNGLAIANNKIIEHEGEIGKISGKIERLPIIEEKVDKLLENQGINPKQIERNMTLATTTNI